MIKKILFFLLLVVFFVQIGYRVFVYKNAYTSKYNPAYWRQRYLESQWVATPKCGGIKDPHINPATCKWDDTYFAKLSKTQKLHVQNNSIGDDALYAYTGWEYVHGKDPTLLNAEMPPFGKYLIGLSIIIFHNQNIFALFAGLFMLVSMYIVNKVLFKDNLYAFLPVMFVSFEPLFYEQLRAPFLDTLYVALFLLSTYFFLKHKYICSGILLGLMMGTKSSTSTFLLVLGVFFLTFLIQRRSEWRSMIMLPVSAGIVFTLLYLRFFMLGHGPIAFLKVQDYVIHFYLKGAKGIWFAVWQMIFTGHWNSWWGTYENIPEWSVTWLVLVAGPLFYALLIVIRRVKLNDNFLLLEIFSFCYLIFLVLIPTWPRYLLLLFPFAYNLLVWSLLKSIPRPWFHALE